ncbi:TPA: helix-turn-helix domain-containing protein [Streptococcus suis]|uniref:helix-turn-helix domain-containing protein n=1 Tax=Streptococcus suis TaxID=1307 RepID=UPI0005CF5DA6|nr:helix-turn-helix domain-containing protein [Streptococcus suis]MDN2978503.1 helix-turn-helix domain-containing protein [Streptococcus suis]NQM69326.1 helix-turn-helix domain-containing protein [Streptococcus suis]CYY24297.1 prophage LambdaSa03%2C transcriptional regulator%2CCro/CI family [Streptococcus suis]CZA11697.1 prophage LambdaSa03%2C transcriptional regulator%2CCro/CI family [Streptococcus suis]HEM4881527.1 helix-turn-helix domain-containing protein [Streptococcus suis]
MRQQSTAERLKIIMQERNLKQVDVIEKSKPFQEQLGIKLGKSALSQYVNGIQSPDQHKLTLLSLTLDVSEAWLMGYDVPREREIKNSPQPIPTIDLSNLRERVVLFDGKPLSDEDVEKITKIIELSLEVSASEDR